MTSLSAVNPTKVLLGAASRAARSGGGAVAAAMLLETGESHLLAERDKVLLVAYDPSMWVEYAGPARPGDAAAPGAAAGGGVLGGMDQEEDVPLAVLGAHRSAKKARKEGAGGPAAGGAGGGGADGKQNEQRQAQQAQQAVQGDRGLTPAARARTAGPIPSADQCVQGLQDIW